MHPLVEMALGNAVAATALAAIVFAVARLIRTPAWTHCLWLLVLLKLVTPPVISIPVPASWIPRFVPHGAEAADRDVVSDPPGSGAGAEVIAAGTIEAAGQPVDPSALGTEAGLSSHASGLLVPPPSTTFPEASGLAGMGSRAPIEGSSSSAQQGTWAASRTEGSNDPIAGSFRAIGGRLPALATVLLYVWAGGTVLIFLGIAARIYQFRRALRWAMVAPGFLQQEAESLARRLGVAHCPRLRLLDGKASPMLWALMGEANLLFPSDLLKRLSPEARRTLLLHELAHLRRGDHWVRLLEAAVTALYWWHPVVWWARREIGAAEEACCDSWVVSEMPDGREMYAAALVEAACFSSESRAGLPVAASGLGSFAFLKHRVTMIMLGDFPKKLSPLGRLAVVAAALICLPLLPTRAGVERGRQQPATGDTVAADESAPLSDAPSQRVAFANRAVAEESVEFESPPKLLTHLPKEVWSVAFSPDGKRLAVGAGRWDLSGGVQLWDTVTHEPLQTAKERHGTAFVTFSPDGALLACSPWEYVVHLRDARTLRLIRTLSMPSVTRVAFSPDGKTMATASEGVSDDDSSARKVRLWDVATGAQRVECEGPLCRLHCVAFSPDGSLVAVGGGNWHKNPMGEVILWDAATGKRRLVLKGHSGAVISCAFSPDGKRIASGGLDTRVRLYDVASGKLERQFESRNPGVEGLAFSPDGKTLASVGRDRHAKLWSVAEGTLAAELLTDPQGIHAVAFSPDGSILATGGLDGLARLWDVASRRQLGALGPEGGAMDPLQPVYSLACSPDGTTLASAHDKSVRLRNATTGEVQRVFPDQEDRVQCVAYSADKKSLAAAVANRIDLWDPATGTKRTTLQGHAGTVFSIAFSPDGKKLASGALDHTLRLWDVATASSVATQNAHASPVQSVAFAPGGRLLASGGGDRTVKLWDADTLAVVATLKGHEAPVQAVAFSPDGARVASADQDGDIRFWDVSTGQARLALVGRQGRVDCLAFSPSGKTLASGGWDNTIVLWDTDNGVPRTVLREHNAPVTSLVFGRDALISGGYDGRALRWQASAP